MGRPPTERLRAPVAVVLLTAATAGALADALLGGRLMDTPVVPVAAAVSAYLAGSWLSPAAASIACLAGASVLTAANQITDASDYSVPNDLFFFAVLLGGTALAGAVIGARRSQVRELRRLTTVRQQQRDAQVRTTRLEEANRIAGHVVESLTQRLGALVMQASGAARVRAGTGTSSAFGRMETSAREALAELREVVGSLREPAPYAAPAAVAGAAERHQRHQRHQRHRDAAPRLDWTDLLAGGSGLPLAFESVASSLARGPGWANAVAGLAVGLPLVVRRRRPFATVLLMSVAATTMSAWLTPVPMTVSVLLPLSLAAFSLGGHAHGWQRAGGLVVLGLGVVSTELASPRQSSDPDGITPTLLWLALAVLAGVVAQQHARRAGELRRLLEDIESGRHHALRLAVVEERVRTARELHDSVAHAMTVICLQAEAAQQHPGDDALRQACAATIEATARGAMDELRQGLVELETGGTEAVPGRELAEGFATTAASLGIVAEIRVVPVDLEVPGTTADVVRRVVREALVNVARHAPDARVRVRCAAATTGVEVEVLDDGARREFAGGTGTGLQGLAELVRTVDGTLEHGTTATGYRVASHLPCDLRVLT